MSNPRGNDYNGAEGSLAHNAGWKDVWGGLLLTVFLLGTAMLVAVLFSGRPSSLSRGDEPVAVHTKYLQGVRDPSRPGWRTADRPWDLAGIHEMRPDFEDRVGENRRWMEDKHEGGIGRHPQIEDDRALARQEPAHSVDVAQRPHGVTDGGAKERPPDHRAVGNVREVSGRAAPIQ